MQLNPPDHSNWLAAPSPSFSHQQKYWLFRPGALTAGLRKLGKVQLRVIREHADGLHPAEAWMLQRPPRQAIWRSEEHTSELQSREKLVCRLLLEKKHQ